MELILVACGIVGIAIIPFYILYKISWYSKLSRHWFFVVHTSVWLDERLWLRQIFKSYLWLFHEYRTFVQLEKVPWYGRIMTNLLIPQWVTISDTEIDLLFIHTSWIYVIEAKDYGGYIYGNRDESFWTQKFSRRISLQVANPLKQNYSHIKSLEHLLPRIKEKIIPLVIFSNRSKLFLKWCDGEVLQKYMMQKYFRQVSLNRLSPKEIDTVYESLVPYAQYSENDVKNHNQQIRNLYW